MHDINFYQIRQNGSLWTDTHKVQQILHREDKRKVEQKILRTGKANKNYLSTPLWKATKWN